jgi:hypothetical protein
MLRDPTPMLISNNWAKRPINTLCHWSWNLYEQNKHPLSSFLPCHDVINEKLCIESWQNHKCKVPNLSMFVKPLCNNQLSILNVDVKSRMSMSIFPIFGYIFSPYFCLNFSYYFLFQHVIRIPIQGNFKVNYQKDLTQQPMFWKKSNMIKPCWLSL